MTARRTDGRDRSGRGWAYVGVVLGGAVSVAANVAASFIPPPHAVPGWTPPAGAVVSAVFWPLLLMVAVELFARVGWPDGWRWWLLRAAGVLPVAAIAAVVSYRHLSHLLRFYGEDPLTAVLGPLAVDGLMVMAAGALIASGRRRAGPPTTIGATAAPLAAQQRPGSRTDRPRRITGGTGDAQRTDTELIGALETLPREADGTVPVRRAAKALGTGPDRARRLLSQAGLLRTRPVDALPDRSPAPGTHRPTPPAARPGPVPVRVPDPPVPAAIDVPESDVR